MHPTGSVEQLYSPSYGSRASSSLSLNSSGNRSDLNVSFHSSLPMVYCSSQERLGSKSNSRRVPRPKWSSHDRLLSPLLPTDIETLASRGKSQLPAEQAATHRQYHSHLYTPKRTRKTEAGKLPAIAVNVERSASFNSPGFYRSSSDGFTKDTMKEKTLAVQQPPVTMNNLTLDDMPALPPQTTRDINSDSPDVSQDDTLSSLPVEDETDLVGSTPPPVPYCEPPMFTPYAKEEIRSSSETPATDATFDYNDLSPSVQSGTLTSSHVDNDFDFSLPESPPPPPPPVSTLPQDEQTPPTSPLHKETPPSSSPGEEEAPPTPLTSPPHEEAPPTSEETPLASAGDEVLSGSLSKSSQPLDRHLTPRTALIKAFEDLDKIGESILSDDDGVRGDGEVIGVGEDQAVDVDHLYAKVDITKKKGKQELTEKQDSERNETTENSELVATFKPELVHKAASIEDIVGPDYAEVYHPKRASMPPGSSPTHSPTHSEPVHARIESSSGSTQSEPPYARIETSSAPTHSKPGFLKIGTISSAPPGKTPPTEPHPPQGKLYEVTSDGNVGQKNQRSLKKLGVMFGPEFKSLSGFPTLNKPSSVKVCVSVRAGVLVQF